MHHHSRRKSGHHSANTSMTDVRKASSSHGATSEAKSRRPQTLARRSTPQTVQKLGKSPRDREREWQDERWYEDDRESFPQYCMTCDKQFIPHDERLPYCSEVCRQHDQGSTETTASSSSYSLRSHDSSYYHAQGGPASMNMPFYSADQPEPRDIIPRASPSRPSSRYWSPPATPTTGATQYTSAVSALKSLSIRPPSPPSPVSAATTGSSGIWPFARSAATSPGTSYTRPAPNMYSSTYDGGVYGGASSTAYGAGYGAGYSSTMATDRPLPSRRPGGYSRPKSVELVTPMIGR